MGVGWGEVGWILKARYVDKCTIGCNIQVALISSYLVSHLAPKRLSGEIDRYLPPSFPEPFSSVSWLVGITLASWLADITLVSWLAGITLVWLVGFTLLSWLVGITLLSWLVDIILVSWLVDFDISLASRLIDI